MGGWFWEGGLWWGERRGGKGGGGSGRVVGGDDVDGLALCAGGGGVRLLGEGTAGGEACSVGLPVFGGWLVSDD